jgi:uncharacterized damage-inducible protein DinB
MDVIAEPCVFAAAPAYEYRGISLPAAASRRGLNSGVASRLHFAARVLSGGAAMLSTLFQTYARYNAWMNENIYGGCAKLSDAERRKDMGAFFKSIHGTLNHGMVGDLIWTARLTGKPVPNIALDQVLHEDFEALRAARRSLDASIQEFTAGLRDEWLTQPFTWTSRVYANTFTHPTWFLVLQMFNHQTHHRGQVTTLMKQLGVDPGPTDLPAMPLDLARAADAFA